MGLTVSRLAKVAGVSVRTLHHYDEIGLLRPSNRNTSGYRFYSQADLERLQQILVFKEMGFPLEEVHRLLTEPGFDREAALRMQRQLLREKAARVQQLLDAVDRALGALQRGINMTKEEMFVVFGDDDPSRHEAEAEQRWGHTEAYKESKRRTTSYGKQDWTAMKAEAGEIYQRLVAAVDQGFPADSAEARAAAEAHRLHIERWFYPCPRSMHRSLGEMYIADPRFTEFFEKLRPGLAEYARDAFVANATQG
jgi:DNA-binding transcriptional MerR regulator